MATSRGQTFYTHPLRWWEKNPPSGDDETAKKHRRYWRMIFEECCFSDKELEILEQQIIQQMNTFDRMGVASAVELLFTLVKYQVIKDECKDAVGTSY